MFFAEKIQEGWTLIKVFLNGPGAIWTIFLVAVAAASWLIARASTSIIGEYAKRAWFRYIHREALQRESRALAEARQALATAKAEFAGYQSEVGKLIEDHERLMTQFAWTMAENARLRKALLRYQKPPSRDGEPVPDVA